MKRPDMCVECHIPLMPRSSSGSVVADLPPGTRYHGGQGLCVYCYGAAWTAGTVPGRRLGPDLMADIETLMMRTTDERRLAAILGLDPRSVERQAYRHGRKDLVHRLTNRVYRKRVA